ncbi:hypothetical protein LINPERPRIM_LOCUS38376 [Linum perenne]
MPITAAASLCRGTARRPYSRGWITALSHLCRPFWLEMSMGRLGSSGTSIGGHPAGIC